MARSRKPEEAPEESAPGDDLDRLKDELDSLLSEPDDSLDSLPDEADDSAAAVAAAAVAAAAVAAVAAPDETEDDAPDEAEGDAPPDETEDDVPDEAEDDAPGAFAEDDGAPGEGEVPGTFDETPPFTTFKSTAPTFGEKLKAGLDATVQYIQAISGWGWAAIITAFILLAGFILGMYSLSQAKTDYDAYKSLLYGAGLLMLIGIFMATWLSLGEIYREMVGRVIPFLGPNREGEGFEEGAEELPAE